MASKRHIRRKACEGKKVYPDNNLALMAAGKASDRAGQWISPYKCEFCGKWHIGHPPKRIKQAIRANRGY